MKDFKLKMIITLLGSIIFSFIFIILALMLPTKENKTVYKKKSGRVGEISKSFKR
jgi:hypothetical protein